MRYLRHFTAASMLVCVLFAVISVAASASLFLLPAILAAGAIAAVLFRNGVYRPGAAHPGAKPAWPLAAAGSAATVVAYGGAIMSGVDIWPSVTLPAVFVAAVMAGTDWPRPQVTGIGLALVGLCAAAAGEGWWRAVTAVAATALCLAALMIQLWVWEIANRGAEAAVTDERLRFAADLHDIQGHSLQVIALKSELAARLADTDPARAAAEMREVQALARDTLRDTREVAQGYREVSLHTEITNAVRVLAAAGIRCHTESATPGRLPPTAERLLALVVREATTNILRHSTAAEAAMTWSPSPDRLTLTIRNDAPLAVAGSGSAGGDGPADRDNQVAQQVPDSGGGQGGGEARRAGDSRGGSGPGSGLSALAQRFAAAGGRLTWRAEPHRFTLEAELPR